MAFNWGEYLTFAKDLYKKQDIDGITCSREAIDRCIVSRAYYAAFHHAKNMRKRIYINRFPGIISISTLAIGSGIIIKME
jgi:uncharacterized protein (UPF0332 family)